MVKPHEISLYFHIPFCTKKCPYCHFYVVKDNASLKKRLITSLKKEWDQKYPLIEGKKIVSIYFGGGTPSLLNQEELSELLSLFPFPLDDIEITLEANPESLTLSDLVSWRSLGINRLSIGVQSFDDLLLKKLGRTHDAEKSLQGIEEAKKAGFDNISIDLMYDIPGQTELSFATTLRKALALPITHISLYNLIIEPETAFFRKKESLKKELPKEEESFAMLKNALTWFSEAEFNRYEISAFAKTGYESKHNSGYWKGRSFFGFGPSAFSYFENERFSNVANLIEYEKKLSQGESPATFSEKLASNKRFRELLAIRLRYLFPFALTDIDKHVPEEIFPLLFRLAQEGYIHISKNRFSLTEKGTLFYDTVASEIV